MPKDFPRRMSTLPTLPLPLVRHCIGLLLACVCVLAGVAVSSGQPAQPANPAISRINQTRAAQDSPPLDASVELDQLAASYLDELLAQRSLTPSGYGTIYERHLSDDVAAALGAAGADYRYVGLVIAYGQNPDHAMSVALGTRSNGPALLEPAMTLAGLATGTIPQSVSPWFAPPPGGVGRDVELTGMTLLVIVTAGTYRADF